MIEYTDTNMQWLMQLPGNRITVHSADNRYYNLEQGDATTHQWKPVPTFVAGETYLGRPFTSLPDPQTLAQTVSECNLIIKKFLRNIGSQITARHPPLFGRACMAGTTGPVQALATS